jgi:DNA-binding NtrC family response regulator
MDAKQTPIVLMTAYGTIDRAVSAMKKGAKDFIEKPFTKGILAGVLAKHSRFVDFDEVIMKDKSTKDLAEKLKMAASHNGLPVLLLGESGVGKDVFANLYHKSTNRKGRFISVNCGAIPSNMLESILFGHEKGSFTGANKKHDGKFIQASGGTLFLDEIGEMSMDLQVKLLRVLETRMVERVGSSEEVEVDIALVAATNANIKKKIEKGEFREDLYYRLNVMEVNVPPLRERPEDLKFLIQHFIDDFNQEYDKELTITDACVLKLMEYEWPGNIRELRNIINRASIVSSSVIESVEVFPKKDLSLTEALDRHNGNRKEAAEYLGISLRTLQYRIKEKGLNKR